MKAYVFRLNPAKSIIDRFEEILNLCRELYNAGVQERRDAYKCAHKSIHYLDQANQLIAIKEERTDIASIHSQIVQDVLRRLQKAFDNYFRRVREGAKEPGYPRFKSKNRYKSFTYPQSGFRLIGNKVKLSKIGTMRVILHRPIEGKIKTCSIKREADGWYVIFCVEENQSRFFPKTGKSTGVDLGIESLATLADGTQIENPRHLKKAEKALKRAQRKVSRRKKGSNRRRKAVILLAKKHLALSRTRLDFHHRLALFLVKEFDHIAIEDLNIKGLLKNHHLAKAISDLAWGTFVSILLNKAESAGRVVEKVDPKFTSQDCSQCGARVRKSLCERTHQCIQCGLTLHRDHNAAINIQLKARCEPSGMEAVALPDEPRSLGL